MPRRHQPLVADPARLARHQPRCRPSSARSNQAIDLLRAWVAREPERAEAWFYLGRRLRRARVVARGARGAAGRRARRQADQGGARTGPRARARRSTTRASASASTSTTPTSRRRPPRCSASCCCCRAATRSQACATCRPPRHAGSWSPGEALLPAPLDLTSGTSSNPERGLEALERLATPLPGQPALPAAHRRSPGGVLPRRGAQPRGVAASHRHRGRQRRAAARRGARPTRRRRAARRAEGDRSRRVGAPPRDRAGAGAARRAPARARSCCWGACSINWATRPRRWRRTGQAHRGAGARRATPIASSRRPAAGCRARRSAGPAEGYRAEPRRAGAPSSAAIGRRRRRS